MLSKKTITTYVSFFIISLQIFIMKTYTIKEMADFKDYFSLFKKQIIQNTSMYY